MPGIRYLSALVFVTGAVTLGMELSASRLLEPAFGNSQIVWAALIGLILLYLAIGAWLGGRLYDLTGSYATMWWLSVALGVFAALINLPVRESPIVRPLPVAV